MKSRKMEYDCASSSSTRAVGQFFDIYAKNFDTIYGHTGHRSALGRCVDRAFRQVMVRRFEETLRQTEKPAIHSVLDIGCGPGRYTAAFALQGKEAVGVDIAEEMLKIAQNNIDTLNVTADLVLGDYLSVHFDRVFDAACLMGFFDYIEDPVPILKKLAAEVTSEFYASFPKSGGFLAWQRQIRYRLRRCPLWLYSKRDVEDALIASGFARCYKIRDFGRDWYVVVQMQSTTGI